MKKFVFFILLLNLIACAKGPSVEIPFRAYVTIPPGLNTGLSHHFIINDLPGVDYENLIDAQPSNITLSIEYGENTLDFVEQAYFYAKNQIQLNEMGYLTLNPISNYNSLQLNPSTYNLSDHITQDLFDTELKLIFRSIPLTETQIRIDFSVSGFLEE